MSCDMFFKRKTDCRCTNPSMPGFAINDADEVDPNLNLVKGCGGARKMVEAASDKFVVVVDDSTLVSGLRGSGLAMPVKIVQFCWKYKLLRLQKLFGKHEYDASLRLSKLHNGLYVCIKFHISSLSFKNYISGLVM